MSKPPEKSKRIGHLCAELKDQIQKLNDPKTERVIVDEHTRKRALRSAVFRAIKKQLSDLSE